LIAAGGTGGHVYPALAAAEAISSQRPDVKLSFVGSVGGFERPLVAESGVQFDTYDEVRGGPVVGVPLLTRLKSAVNLAIGTKQAFRIILRHKPQALMLTGGWSGLPVALAAWALRVPSLIYLPDIEPGTSIRVLQRFATRVAITAPESAVYFPAGKTVVTGYPLRRMMLEAKREAGIAHFGLDRHRKTVLFWGGSRGAHSINQGLADILLDLLADGLQVIHVSGTLDWPDVEQWRMALADASHYHAYPYLHDDMGLAMAAADLTVSRAGASTLGEFPAFALPSILIPYPYAWRYQKVNADYLASQGAAVVMKDADMPPDLLPTIRRLLADPARLQQMSAGAARLAHPDSAARLGHELLRLAGETT
jgi:UDP-N-acetylglucosamine--N-acetylmuramyl-(pentapeptide) pyrophosphoryl-undecaprenol N-acetylglucosamine transferase